MTSRAKSTPALVLQNYVPLLQLGHGGMRAESLALEDSLRQAPLSAKPFYDTSDNVRSKRPPGSRVKLLLLSLL